MRLIDKERLDRAIKLLDENKVEEAKDLLQLIKDSNHGFFRITAITKEDIIGEFESKYGRTSKKTLRVKYIVKNLSEDEMEWFACELADSYLEMLFLSLIHI